MKKYFKRAAVTMLWLSIVPAVTIIGAIIALPLYLVVRLGLKSRMVFDIIAAVSGSEFIPLSYCIKHGENVKF